MKGYVNLFGSWFIHRHHLLLIILYDHLWWMILHSTGHAQPLSGHCSEHVLLFAGQKFRLGSHHPDIFTNYNVIVFLFNLQSLPKILRCMLVLGPCRNRLLMEHWLIVMCLSCFHHGGALSAYAFWIFDAFLALYYNQGRRLYTHYIRAQWKQNQRWGRRPRTWRSSNRYCRWQKARRCCRPPETPAAATRSPAPRPRRRGPWRWSSW
jgi:hypothetical protein